MFGARRAPGGPACQAAAHDVQDLSDGHQADQRTSAVSRSDGGKFATLDISYEDITMVIFYAQFWNSLMEIKRNTTIDCVCFYNVFILHHTLQKVFR